MIFKIFRVILIILSLIVAILQLFAITGSYKNQNYLTDTYLINFHLDNLNLGAVIDYSKLTKRELQEISTPVNYFDKTKKRSPSAPSKREAQESGWYYLPGSQTTQSAGDSQSASVSSATSAATSHQTATSVSKWWNQASGTAAVSGESDLPATATNVGQSGETTLASQATDGSSTSGGPWNRTSMR